MGKGSLVAAFAAVCMFSACDTAPKRASERIVPVEQESDLSQQLERNLDLRYGSWKDTEVEALLNGIIKALVASDTAYQKELGGARVHLLAARERIAVAGLGVVIFFSRGAMAGAEYENEVAFLLGTSLALLKDKVPFRQMEGLQGQDIGRSLVVLPTAPPALKTDHLASGWFDQGGLFDFGPAAYLAAEKEAVRLVYAANYDPRGAVTLIQRWAAHASKLEATTEERLAQARGEIARLSPQRGPKVSSQAFERASARMQVKKAKGTRR